MTDAPRFLWEGLGRPAFAAASTSAMLQPIEAECCICRTTESPTASADKALGANFADRGHLSGTSDRICAGCLWCCSGKPPATLRMWSIVATPTLTQPASHPKVWLDTGTSVCLTNRANPAPIRDALLDPPSGPWLVTVAYSGQKHVVPYAPINQDAGQWTIRVEDHYVTATPDLFRTVWEHATQIRRLGVPEDAVMTGDPRYIRTQDQLATWHHHNQQLAPYLGSPLLRLALWTITKETMK